MLIGREREREAVAQVVDLARGGESATLVLRGDPGVGKSALLAQAIEAAREMRVLRATGIESEAELEYSGLLELGRPLVHLLDRLASRQADALRVALGLGDGDPPDRFVVGAATLSLLAAAGEEVPTLVVVDDAQWLDRASADALRFAARRLLADRVGFLLAARPSGFEAAGLSELQLKGLDPASTAALAEQVGGSPLGEREAVGLTEATAGNPLAVIELVRAGLGADPATAAPLPVTEAIERAFAGRLADLPDAASKALCVAGAEGVLGPLAAALGSLGGSLEDLAPAEDAGLVSLDADAVRFAHPLLRSVAYHARPASERRAAHAALAAALARPADAERRAWHLAAAALGPDEVAAGALAEVAETARARGGQAAVAEALERAARLTPNPATRGRRLAGAAEAAWDLGETARASALVEEALAVAADPAERARLTGLAGRIEFQSGDLERAHRLVLDAADALADLGRPAQAVTMLGVGSLVLHNLARPGDAAALGRRALELADGEPEDVRLRATYHLGRALRITGRAAEAEPLLEAVVAHLLAPEAPSRLALQRAAIALAVLDRPQEAMPLARRTLEVAHAAGPMQVAYALSLVAQVEMYLGDWRAAVSSASEGLVLCRDMGQDNVAATFASFLARIAGARGDGDGLRRWEPLARAAVEASGNRFERLQLDHAAGLLALGEDRPARRGRPARRRRGRVGEPRRARPRPRRRTGSRRGARAARPQGRGARGARGLARARRRRGACSGPRRSSRAAVVSSTRTTMQARRRSCRRSRTVRRSATRTPLRARACSSARRCGGAGGGSTRGAQLAAAVETFERLDAEAWAERGRRELRASGAKLRRSAEAGDELTPQELQIALQVAEGKANKEVAAVLFLSPKTVEFHLSRIYRKLGVSSRAELVRRLASAAA